MVQHFTFRIPHSTFRNLMSVERVSCPRCGALNDPEARQCLICGAPLLPYAPQGAPIAPPAPPTPPGIGGVPALAPHYAAPPVAPHRSGLPLIALALGVVGLCLVAVLGVGVLVLLPAGTIPFLAPPTPTPVDPAQVLDGATARLADIQTMHYDMVVTFADQPTGTTAPPTVTLHLVGDVAFPDRYTMHTDQFGDLIVLGEDAYVRQPSEQRWARRLASDASPALAPTNPTVLPQFIHFARDPILDGEVVSGTLHLHKINFLLNTAQMIAEEGPGSTGSILSGSRVVCDAYIGATDHRLYRLLLNLELRGNNKATIEAAFSNFNTPVTIEAPTDLVP